MSQTIVDYILVTGGFQSFFLTALLFRKKEKSLHDLIIGIWMIFLGSYILFFALSREGLFLRHPWLISFYISLLLLIGPFLFLYIKALTEDAFKPGFRDGLHFLPFLLFNLYSGFFFPHEMIFGVIHERGTESLQLPSSTTSF